MANIAKKYINEEIDRLNSMNQRYRNLSSKSRNLNLLSLRGDLAPVFHREKEIESIQKLMLRRTKPNALLVGVAGCGKTAIAEALAAHIANQRATWLSEVAKAEREYDKALAKCSRDPETGELLMFPKSVKSPSPLCVMQLSMTCLSTPWLPVLSIVASLKKDSTICWLSARKTPTSSCLSMKFI